MNSIAEFIKSKMKFVGGGQLHMPKDDSPVNITKILRNPKKILIIPYNRLGTILLSARVFKSFRDRFKSSEITVAVENTWSVLIKNDPTVDEVFTYGDEIENPSSNAFQALGKRLAAGEFDIAFFLSYQFDTSMAYLTRLSGADLRISFKADTDNPFFNVEIVPASGTRYEIERYLEMLRTLGIDGKIRDYTVAVNDSIIQTSRRRFLAGNKTYQLAGFDLTREIAGESISRKTAESVIKTLVQDLKSTVIVFYEPGKKTIAAALKEVFGKQIILVEDRPISTIAGMLSQCSFVVSHNTDLFQLTVTLKIPTLCIMKKDEIVQWSPGENENIMHLQRSSGSWPSSQAIVHSAKKLLKMTNKS